MATVINIFVLRINSIASNASVNIGESVINSPTSSNKYTGYNASYGDAAPPYATMKNTYVDPDVNDMNEIGSYDTAKTIQG
ncbi:spore germination protein [Cohnella sp. CFH 77786]|uniref:spore germination protein n=1 Tax=Cohnella sp. CFH 77786 TaxID=2662265 RepID=UPI001ED317E9|nr:spore germination protein [Cohnella sp. CFH 77786]